MMDDLCIKNGGRSSQKAEKKQNIMPKWYKIPLQHTSEITTYLCKPSTVFLSRSLGPRHVRCHRVYAQQSRTLKDVQFGRAFLLITKLAALLLPWLFCFDQICLWICLWTTGFFSWQTHCHRVRASRKRTLNDLKCGETFFLIADTAISLQVLLCPLPQRASSTDMYV